MLFNLSFSKYPSATYPRCVVFLPCINLRFAKMNSNIKGREVIMKYYKLMLLSVVTAILLSDIPALSADSNDNSVQDNYMARYFGLIERMPEGSQEGVWMVNDRGVLVTEDTKIEEAFGKTEVGAFVEIEGDYVDKTFKAYKIEVIKAKD